MEANTQIINLSYEELDFVMNKIISPNPNKEDIAQTNQAIRSYSKNIVSVEGFLLHIKNNSNFKIRQLAAVLLNRRIEKHWNKMDTNTQTAVKDLLLQLFMSEKQYLVMKAIAILISKIAKALLVASGWTDIHDFIFTDPTKYSQEQAGLFELNLYIISELIETCPNLLKDKLLLIKSIIEVSLNMGSQKMKEYSTKCLGNVVRCFDSDQLIHFRDSIPVIFKEIKNFTEDTVFHVYETLCDFHHNSLNFFDNHIDNIIEMTFWLLNNQEYNGNTKLVLSEFFLMLSEVKKKTMIKNDAVYLKGAIELGYKLLSSNQETDEEFDDGQMSDYSIGSRIIEYLSVVISSKHIFPLCSNYITKLMLSDSEYERRASVTSIGLIAEGCATRFQDVLEDIVNTLVHSFVNDPSTLVKTASIISMDKMTQYCPQICDYHSKIIPMLVQGLESKDEVVVENSLIELNYFCRSLDVELEEYVGELLPRLIYLFNSHKSIKIQESCLFALSSVIANSHCLDVNTLYPLLETCKNIVLNKKAEGEEEIVANALECVGHIATQIKLEKFLPYKDFFTSFAAECLKSGKYVLIDSGFVYFNSLAGIMGALMADYLPDLMSIGIQVIKDESGLTDNKDKDEFGLDSDSEEEGEQGIGNVYVDIDFVDAKCSAILTLSNLAKTCPKEYLYYIEDIIKHFEYLWNHVHDNINIELIMAYENIIIGLKQADENTSDPIYRKAWVSHVFPKYETVIQESDVREEVAKTLECIYNLIDEFGRDLFINNNTLERVIKITKLILDKQATCQLGDDDDEGEEETDYEEQIMGKTIDIFLVLSEKLGNDLHEPFTTIFASLKKYLTFKYSVEERSTVFGCFADVLKYCTVSTKFYIAPLLHSAEENIKKNMKKKDEEMFRHIAYMIGMLFKSDPEESKQYLVESLQMLQTIGENSSKMGKDNVAAAICNIVVSLKLNNEFSFFNQLVDFVMAAIPLKYDHLENPTLFRFLVYLTDKVDLKFYERHFENMLLTIKSIVLNEIKCGTTKELLTDVKVYLETLNQNEILRGAIENFVSNFSDAEKERFLNTVRNA